MYYSKQQAKLKIFRMKTFSFLYICVSILILISSMSLIFSSIQIFRFSNTICPRSLDPVHLDQKWLSQGIYIQDILNLFYPYIIFEMKICTKLKNCQYRLPGHFVYTRKEYILMLGVTDYLQ